MPLPDFPFDHAAAARVWLADRVHHDFSEWGLASPDDPKAWESLETTLSAVSELSPARLMKSIKNVVAQHLSRVDTKRRAVPDKKKEMANEAAVEILRRTNVEWKEESREWLAGALTAFMPRIIKLWKKTKNAEQARTDGGSGNGTSQISSQTRIPERRTRECLDQGSQGAKRVQTHATNRAGGEKEEFAPTSSMTRCQHPPLLLESYIEVQLDEDTSMLLAPTAICDDDCLELPKASIREDHLCYKTFWTLGDLSYGDKEDKLIRDERSFANAIGVMHFQLDKLCLQKTIS